MRLLNLKQSTVCLEAVAQTCSVKKIFLEISQNSQENPCARASFLIKLQAEACNFIKKETLTQVLSCEFCEISKNTFSYRTTPDECFCLSYKSDLRKSIAVVLPQKL